MGRRTAIRRSLWAAGLFIQFILDILSYPHMITMESDLRWNPHVITVGIDLLAMFAWMMLFFFLEDRDLLQSNVTRRLGVFACVLLSVCIVLTNIHAWL